MFKQAIRVGSFAFDNAARFFWLAWLAGTAMLARQRYAEAQAQRAVSLEQTRDADRGGALLAPALERLIRRQRR